VRQHAERELEIASEVDSALAPEVVWFFAEAFPAASPAGSLWFGSSVGELTTAEDFSTAFTSGLLPAVCASAQLKGARASNENMPANSNFFMSFTS